MAKSVTAAFKSVWARKYGRKEILKVLYKRRYWNGAAYVYEAAWTTLEASRVPGLRSITQKLDTSTLNEILSSSVVLNFNDLDRRWLPTTASPSIFAPDDTATSGYEPYLMKFQVQFGYVLDDGTKEYTALFTGVAESYRFDGEDRTVEVTVSGNERFMKDADAASVSTAFTLESCSPATGDGTLKVFLTTSVGVGQVSVVQVAGVTMVQGVDYEINDTNKVTGAQITFTVAPAAAATVKATGRKWSASQTIEAMIALLCDQAGITDRTINPVVFPGSVSGSKTIDTYANWAAGTVLTNTSILAIPGSLKRKWFLVDDFADNNETASPAWTKTQYTTGTMSASTGEFTIGKNAAVANNGSNTATTPFDGDARGTQRLRVKMSANGGEDGYVFLWMDSDGASNQWMTGRGYYLRFTGTSVILGSWHNGAQINFISYTGETFSAYKEYRATRTSDGLFELFVDGVSKGTATNTDYPTAAFVGFTVAGSLNTSITIDDWYWSPEVDGTGVVSTAATVFESAEQDIGVAPAAWSTLDRTEVLAGGTVAYKTASSTTSGGSYSSYAAIAADGTIQSPLRRYFKIKVEITPASGTLQGPEVQKLIARFATSTVVLAIANFTGKTVYSAIQRYAQLADYEFGFDGAGSFYFRSKTVSGSPLVHVTQENAIASVSNYRLGYDRVFTKGRVRYGENTNEYSCTDAGEAAPSPLTRFGARVKDEDHSDIILSNDSTIAGARARLIHDNNHLSKISFTASCRFIPHVDCSDIARVTFLDNPRDYNPVTYDPLLNPLNASFGKPLNVLARDRDMKVVGVTHHFPRRRGDGIKTDLDLLEVLS